MKKTVSVMLAVPIVVALSSVAFAWGPGMGYGMGSGMGYGMGGYGMGPGAMGWGRGAGVGPGAGICPGFAGPNAATSNETAVTEEQAKKAATEYVAKYFPGYTVERVLPFTGRFATMYQVELKGPKGETRVLHVNPWGNVIPFGPRGEG